MPMPHPDEELTAAVLELDEDLVLRLVDARVRAGVDQLPIIEAVQRGVVKVGDRYDAGEYFIADLVMAGLIFGEVLERMPFEAADVKPGIRTVFATAQRDIHDVGKSLARSYFRSRGVLVDDLGVDVPPERILEAVGPDGPAILFLTGLITASYDSMKQTVELLERTGRRPEVTVVVCGLVDEAVCRYVGADHWVRDFVEGYRHYQENDRARHPAG